MLEKIVQCSVSVRENIGVLPLSSDFILVNGCVSSVAFLFDQHPGLFCDYEGVKLQALGLCVPQTSHCEHGYSMGMALLVSFPSFVPKILGN